MAYPLVTHLLRTTIISSTEETPPRHRILIVEDEDAIAETLAYALRTDGFAPVHVRLLADARRELRATGDAAPSLVVLDVGLPDGTGFDLCREIRAMPERGNIPIIMLTARSEEIDRVVGLELGADDYVVKPFSPREVSLRVRTVLRRVSANAPTSGVPIFVLDATAQRITLGGETLNLTRREYLLLKTLLERPSRICSRDMLLNAAWGTDAESGDRTVDTHIKTLRAKLKAARPDLDPIETHRGLGYSVSV
ncbi:MAG: two-component system response regulator CreB [Casimicrobium sp.]